MSTKEKILVIATKVFNERGYGAVNLKELAEVVGISRGNLTYYFKTKEDLLATIVKEMWDKIAKEKAKTMQVPSFENMNNQTKVHRKFQKGYAFIFLDAQVYNHPAVKDQFKAMIEKTIEDYHKMIALGIQLGTVKKEVIPGTYRSLALSIWMVTFFWLSQQNTRGKNNEAESEQTIWGLILPHLTEKGISGFKKYFGEAYYEKLGESFNVHQYSVINF